MVQIKWGVASGKDFPDGLTAGPFLANKKMSLLLVDGNKTTSLPKGLTAEYTFGGAKSVGKAFGKRISGNDRFKTSVKIAEEYQNFENVVLVNGRTFADALSATPLAKK